MRRPLLFSALAIILASLSKEVSCSINFSQNTPNPFQGQNLPPDGTSIRDFPVQVYALVEDLFRVDEQSYTFSILFGLLLQYEDPQTVENVLSDSTDNCTFYCASDPTITLNNDGEPACCDRAFVPGLQAINLIAYNGQSFPAQYQLSILSNSTVAYYCKTLGTFTTDLNYDAYPFDKHFLTADFEATFAVTRTGGSFIEGVNGEVSWDSKYPNGLPLNYDSYRPSMTAIDLPAWRVVFTHFEVMNFTTQYARGGVNSRASKDEVTLSELSGKGFRISIEVERQQTAFYVIVEIIPVCLIVAFSFACFSMPITNVKARFNVLAGQFLTLIVLQFILYTVLPATFQVIKPYLLICVSYGMTFALCGEVIMASWLAHQYKRNDKKSSKRSCWSAYVLWKERAMGMPAPAAQKHHPNQVNWVDSLPREDLPRTCSSSSFVSVEEGGRRSSGDLVIHHPTTREMDEKLAVCEDLEASLQRWRGRKLFRLSCVRELVMMWSYMGRTESQEFCYYVATTFDRIACLFLASAYFVVVVVLFVVASVRATPTYA